MENKSMVRVSGYVRVSTQEQAKEGYSIGAQTERLKSYCSARGWQLQSVYTDPGHSGAKLDRPALQQMLSDIHAGRVDLVLVYKLDRLSRSQKDTLYLIEDVFLKHGVAFVSINENFDTSSAFGRAMIGILSVFAQLEREQIKERTHMGQVERAKDGLWRGGGTQPIGYDYDGSTGELVVNEYEALQVREIFDLYVNKQYSLDRIHKLLMERGYKNKNGDWAHRNSLNRTLRMQLYTGKIVYAGSVYDGRHEPIISPEVFEAAQARLERREWHIGSRAKQLPYKATQLLSGIIYCAQCGARYFGCGNYRNDPDNPGQKKYIHFYGCYSRMKSSAKMVKDPNCRNHIWLTDDLDALVINEIHRLYLNEQHFGTLNNRRSPSLDQDQKHAAVENKLLELNRQAEKLLDLYQYETIDPMQLSKRMDDISKEKKSLELLLHQDENRKPRLTFEQAKDLAKQVDVLIGDGSIEEKRIFIQTLIDRIDIDETNVLIRWSFE